MPTIQLRNGVPISDSMRDDAGDSYIRIGSVLRFVRRHFASGAPVSSNPEWGDSCLVVTSRQTKPFHVAQPEAWASYPAIADEVNRRATGRGGGKGPRYTPFTRAEVFAPVKLVMPDSGTFRAALSYAPVYPTRGHLAVPKPGNARIDVALVYAALAVLNSPLAPAWYYNSTGKLPSRDFTRNPLENIPIVSRNASEREIEQIAFAAHQIISLYEARDEDALQIEEFVTEVRGRLERLLIRAQRLSETEHRELLEPIRKGRSAQYTPSLFEYAGMLPPLPGQVVSLLSDEEHKDFEAMIDRSLRDGLSASEREYYSRLRARYHWHQVVNTPPPRWMTRIPLDEDPKKHLPPAVPLSREKAA